MIKRLKDICSAAILGFTGLINQVQYHAALTDKSLPSTAGGWNGKIQTHSVKSKEKSLFSFPLFTVILAAAKSEPLKIIPPEPDNTTDVEDCIKRAKANDKDLTRININNIREVKVEVLKELLNSLKENAHVEVLEMANVGMTDSVGRVSSMSKIIFKMNNIDGSIHFRYWLSF